MIGILAQIEEALREIAGDGGSVTIDLESGKDASTSSYGWEGYTTINVINSNGMVASFSDGLTLWEALLNLLETRGYTQLATEIAEAAK